MNWFDLLLLVVFILHGLNGYTGGLVRQLFCLFGFLIVLVVSFWGSRYFSAPLAEYIQIEEIIPHHEIMQILGLDVGLEHAPRIIGGLIAFIVLFLILSIAFRLFSGGFRWVNRLPVIGFLNRIGGLILGSLVGVGFIYLIVAVISLIPLPFFVAVIEGSEIVFFLNHYLNPIASEIKDVLFTYYLNFNG